MNRLNLEPASTKRRARAISVYLDFISEATHADAGGTGNPMRASPSRLDPSLHGFRRIRRRSVEADGGMRRPGVDEVENLLEQEQALLRFAQAGADDEAMKTLVA